MAKGKGKGKRKKDDEGSGAGSRAATPDPPTPPVGPRWIWAVPAIAELVVVAALVAAHARIGEIGAGVHSASFVTNEASAGALLALQDASVRMLWGVSWAALLVAGLTAGAVSVLFLRESYRDLDGTPKIGRNEFAAGVLGVLVACALVESSGSFFGGDVTRSLRPPHLSATIDPLTSVTNTTTAAATVLVVLAVSSVLWRHVSLVAAGRGSHPSRDRVKVLLYVGAALLMVGAIEVDYLYRWPAVWLEDPDLGSPAREFARAASTTVGLMGSLQLIAIFLPAFLILRDPRSAEAGREDRPPLAPRELFGRALESSRLVLAVLAPILGTWFEQQFS
ncbi:MAG: hypothetical protein AAGB93_02655 [Planctomycetota bacterium]